MSGALSVFYGAALTTRFGFDHWAAAWQHLPRPVSDNGTSNTNEQLWGGFALLH